MSLDNLIILETENTVQLLEEHKETPKVNVHALKGLSINISVALWKAKQSGYGKVCLE
jgi:hypothetical protein